MSISLDKPLLVVAHDAGGAELIAAWARKHLPRALACVTEGPAKRIFADASFGAMHMLGRNEALGRLRDFDAVLTGSSWGSDLEKDFVGRGKELGVRTITYLDHWTDYRERFLSGGQLNLPQEIWVGDEHAERIARSTFPGQEVRNVGNWYLVEVVAQVKARSLPRTSNATQKRVLFVSEPISAAAERKYGDRNHYGYTEYDAVGGFLDYARTRWAQELESIRIRRHPSEEAGKFAAYMGGQPGITVAESGEQPLMADFAWADWIVGCQSMALVVGLMAGKQVFSAIPQGGRPLEIPYPGIVPLFQTRAGTQDRSRGAMT